MRTTLKRGIGRAGGLNGSGNGHSAVPPLFGPTTLYRQPEPPRRSLIGLILRGFGWLALAVAVLVAGAAGGLYLYTHESVAALKANPKSATGRAQSALKGVASPSQPAVALIAGYDHRAGTGTTSLAGSNSDTLLLVRADPTNHTLSLLSFPRDLYVDIYCHGDTVYTQSRINAAWSICGSNGPYATVDTMEHLTHLNINYLITVDFHAFKQLVNRLHGVYMNVDRRYYIPLHTGTSAINLHPGYQKLDGGQALSFVRFRHFDSDIYRTGRQQLFMEALKGRLRTQLSFSSLPLELPKLIGVLKGNLEYVKAGGGQVSIRELESYLGIAYHLPPGHLFRNQIPIQDFHFFTTTAGADVESASSATIAAAVHSFLHPDVTEPTRLNARLMGQRKKSSKKKRALPKSKISVLVLNAGHVPGEASNTTYLLTKHGYTTKALPVTVPANAPAVRNDTTIFYDPVQPDAKQAAEQLQPLFGPHSRVKQMTTAIAEYAKQAGNPLTVVAVGTSFGGKLIVPHHVALPPPAPPQVSPGLSVTAPRLRGLTPKVHFPVMAPHQIAQYSHLDSTTNEGVRVFKPLRNRHELALTFITPTGLYWQIEETDWSTAPILQNPTGQRFYHHRKLLLYTTGGALQMVAVRTPKATYMVLNTLLNELSNSTMLAIAKSLEPLGR